MSLFRRPARLVLITSTAAMLAAGAASPGLAAEGKPKAITVPASVFKDETSKLCMPRETIDRSKKSTLPKTVCFTRDEWAEKGVTINVK